MVLTIPVRHLQFPNIPLAIPDGFDRVERDWSKLTTIARSFIKKLLASRVFLFNFTAGFIIMAISIVVADIRHNTEVLAQVTKQKQIVMGKIKQWQGIVNKYAQYRDGWYQLAQLQFQAGDKQGAYMSVNKALAIDPEFTQGKLFLARIQE